jgi:glycosyltransferase involved in cell wall biosynthesis
MSYGRTTMDGSRFPSKRFRTARPELPAYGDVDVAIVCESTYPYLRGGLSAVVHQITEANPSLKIGIIHIAWDRESPQEDLYGLPPQVSWVMPVYQSLEEHAATFKAFAVSDAKLSRKDGAAVVDKLFTALTQHLAGSDDLLWELYDEGINPRTRRYRLWPLISTRAFMARATEFFADTELPFTDLFWHLREFFSLAYAVTDVAYPKAGVYHAHTTGAAALLAAAAARQNQGKFLLTEHNLYARDTINHLLERSMDTVVTVDEWRELDHYTTSAMVPAPARVTPSQRAWMAWWARTGLVAYRAADKITYLYPEAIDEAKGLGGFPEKSSVLPNGVAPGDFDEARGFFDARQDKASASDDSRIWQLAYAARVVPIKGLLDLLEALALMVQRGVTNWELDVMGPDGEMPDYAALCRARCEELGLNSHVRFLGSQNLRERFGRYDMLILPSHNEGQPIVVLEAMTIGLPTIGTYVGGMKQLVEDPLEVTTRFGEDLVIGSCGELVNSHDIEGLAQAIERVMSDEQLFESYRRNARARVEHYFHINTAMGMYREIYGQLGRLKSTPVDALTRPLKPKRAAAPRDTTERQLARSARASRATGR